MAKPFLAAVGHKKRQPDSFLSLPRGQASGTKKSRENNYKKYVAA
jgi:hypothetical protein